MSKKILKNKYDEYKEHEGTWNVGDSMTDKSQAEDSDIYTCIEKYGITSLMRQSMAKEELYLDNTFRNMDLSDAVRAREQMDEYFKQMPARARKVFGGNPEIFYQKYRNNEFDEFLQTGALSNEQVEILKGEITNEKIQLVQNNNNNNTSVTDTREMVKATLDNN